MRASVTLKSLVATMLLVVAPLFAESLTPEQQSKLDEQVAALKDWSSAPAIVAAVKAHNTTPDHPEMTNDSWKALTVLDPVVRSYQKNAAAEWLKAHKNEAVTEAFVSGADGTKVAFLTKTTSWSHKGKPKHDNPLKGKAWQGEVEVDASTGARQVQVSVPVLDGGKAIGSIVVGFSISKL